MILLLILYSEAVLFDPRRVPTTATTLLNANGSFAANSANTLRFRLDNCLSVKAGIKAE
jgi:hypothetical protein